MPTVERCRNPFQTRSTTSIRSDRRWPVYLNIMSQSLPNQVNDFNEDLRGSSCFAGVSQSLPNQVNDFNRQDLAIRAARQKGVAIPSKPGQRLQSNGGFSLNFWRFCRNPFQTRSTTSISRLKSRPTPDPGVAIPSKRGQRLQSPLPAPPN